MNKIRCLTLKEPDLWINAVYFEKKKKKRPIGEMEGWVQETNIFLRVALYMYYNKTTNISIVLMFYL
jgi:hypothetical protein